MRKVIFTSFSCLIVVLSLSYSTHANGIITPLQIGFQPIKDNIVLKWKSINESQVKNYVIERSTDNFTFRQIKTVQPLGDNTEYIYTDTNVFKTAARTFYYRLKIIKKDGTFIYSNTVHLSPRISSAKQTWGSIKAIFTKRKN